MNAYVERGKAIRKAIEEAHLKAGAAGMSLAEVIAVCKMSRRQAELQTSKVDLYRAQTPCTSKRRTFHRAHEEDGKAYLAANSAVGNGHGPSIKTCEAIYELIKCSGAMGINTVALRQQTGLAASSVEGCVSWVAKKYGLEKRRDKHKTQGGSGPMRYWQVGMMPEKLPTTSAPVVVKPKTFAATERGKEADDAAWRAMQHGWITTKTKITVAGPQPDMRYTVDRPEPYFSAMRPGEYVEHDSAIARAYA